MATRASAARKHRSDQLEHLSKHEVRELWLQRRQVEAHVAEITELKA